MSRRGRWIYGSNLFFLAIIGFSVVTVVAMNALRAGADADPPLNMKKVRTFLFPLAQHLTEQPSIIPSLLLY